MPDAKQALHDLLNKIAIDHGYDKSKTKVQLFSTGGGNYTSQLYRVILSGNGKHDLWLFAKVACVSEALRALMPIELYDTETFFYAHLLKKYQQLEERYNVPQKHRLTSVKYYGSCEDFLEEILVLEDLSSKGFQVHDRLKSYDWEYAEKCITEMAKVHALSVALCEENPDELKFLSEKLSLGVYTTQLKIMWQRIGETIVSMVKEENGEKVQLFMQRNQNVDVNCYFNLGRLAVVAHGDFRPSNLMHRRRENGEWEVIVLDYQTMRVSNPICDLMYFIFSGSDEKFRDQHFHQPLDHYYSELCASLKRLGVDVEKTYSKADFDSEVKEVQPYGLLMGLAMQPMLTVEAENAPDMSKSKNFDDVVVKPNDLAVTRVNEVVNTFIKLAVL